MEELNMFEGRECGECAKFDGEECCAKASEFCGRDRYEESKACECFGEV